MDKKICIVKVALRDNERIWRRVAVRRSQTLDHLHSAIFKAFDRFDPHLYSFYFPEPETKGQTALTSATEFTSPVCLDEEYFEAGAPLPQNAAKARIGTLNLAVGQAFQYLFDFGDSWWHDLVVEAIDAPAEAGRYPRILEKHGDSPPQYESPEEDREEG